MILIFRKMVKLVQGLICFIYFEWIIFNLIYYVNVELERVVVERFVEELKRLFEEIVKCIEKIQRDVSKKLGKFKYFLMLYICYYMVEFFYVLIILSFTFIQFFIICLLYL